MKKVWNSLAGVILGITLMLGAPVMETKAAEYTVTDAEAVLYTNENTVILSDADDDAIVLPDVAAGLPIQVTGVTSNGYFRIQLDGQIFYIHGIGLSAANTDSQIYDTIMAQKAVFPEGMHWTNDNYYGWKGGTYTGGFGCAGFAFAVSDAAFGDTRAQIHKDYSNIKVGDILRVDNDTHSVIVLAVKESSVIVAEGNYNGTIHWGREIPKTQLVDPSSYIMTRCFLADVRHSLQNEKRRSRSMEKITSFTIDHNKLQPGVYVSRKDNVGAGIITTFDLRMTSPNEEPVMNTAEVHTIEHLAATFLRNHKVFGDKTIYFGPMGCRTGFYLLLAGDYASKDIVPLMIELYEFIRDYKDEVPGASPKDCGNYLDMNLGMANYLAKRYLDTVLYHIDDARLIYPE